MLFHDRALFKELISAFQKNRGKGGAGVHRMGKIIQSLGDDDAVSLDVF